MPNIKSAEKRMRTSEKARQRNVEAKSKLKTLRRNLLDGMASGNADQSQAAYRAYSSGLDKAAKRGIIAKNSAIRKKNRAAAQLKQLAAK